MNFMTGLFSALAFVFLAAGAAQAQQSSGFSATYVSRTGNDASGSCSSDAPCRSLSVALSKTIFGGEVACLDGSAQFDHIVITGSVNIDCSEVSGVGGLGINIQLNTSDPQDTRKTVRLRGLRTNVAFVASPGIHITGAATGFTVVIEDCVIYGNFLATGRGIDDARSGGGKLYITNTTIRDNLGAGISVIPASGASNIQVLLSNVQSHHNGTGAQFGNLTRVMIDQSVFSGNAGAGILTVAGAIVDVDRSTMSHNANGVQTSGGGAITLANSNIKLNTSQGVNVSGGTVVSFGNNRIAFNASPGTAPSPAGAASSDLGQQ